MKIFENSRKLKNSLNLLLLFVKLTKFFKFYKKITIKTIVFSNSVLKEKGKWTKSSTSWKISIKKWTKLFLHLWQYRTKFGNWWRNLKNVILGYMIHPISNGWHHSFISLNSYLFIILASPLATGYYSIVTNK